MQLGNTNCTTVSAACADSSQDSVWGKDGFTLKDVWDTINPLEHIPFISNLYDAMTGEKPSAGSQIAGGALYGGPIGIIFSAINVAFESQTGHDVVGSMVAALTDDETPGEPVKVAKAAGQSADADAPMVVADAVPTEIIEQTPVAEILPPVGSASVSNLPRNQSAQDVLSLFDASNAAAHSSYRKAQALTVPVASSSGFVM